MLRWPDRAAVQEALRRWAERVAAARPEVLRVGYFGSYARGRWGPGSDLDVVVVVRGSDRPWPSRGLEFPAEDLPVPAEVLVYTEREWNGGQSPFLRRLRAEVVWVYGREGGSCLP